MALNTKNESFGIILIEAMASKNVVVASDISGYKELINNKNGILFKNKDLVPACLLGCLISALYALPFGINFDLNNDQILFLFIMCLLILPIPFMILTISPKFAPAHEVALIFLLESVLGTAWVWFVINEIPPLNTIIGGALLLGSVTIFIYQTTRNTN